MAEDLTIHRPMTMPQGEQPKRRRGVYPRRFALAYALLAVAVLGAGALLYAALVVEPSADRRWSAWEPQKEGAARLYEIAQRVGAHYADGGSKLPFQVVPSAPTVRVRSASGEPEQIPLDAAVITGRNADAVGLDTSIAFSICGRGRNCAIDPRSVQREFGTVLNGVLELALYTFKFEADAESVLFFMPPIPSTAPDAGTDGILETVVLLQRTDVERELERPLSATPISTTGEIGKSVLRVIRPHLYTFTYDTSSQGASLLRLTPYGSAGAVG